MKSWNDVSPIWKKILKVLAILMVAFLVSMLFNGCNTEKYAIRKQDKAFGITVSTPRTFAQAAAIWLEIHPCLTPIIKDSTVTKHDTITTEKKVFIPYINTQYKTKVVDTIIDGISVYVDSTGITVKNLNQKEVETKTIYQTKVDQTLVNLQKDTINSLRVQSGVKDGITQELRTSLSNQKKETNKWLWYFIASLAFMVVSHVARTYISKINIPSILKGK